MSINPIYNSTQGSSQYTFATPLYYNNLPASIFSNTQNASALETQFETVQKEQGILGKAWDGIKNFFHIGLSSNDVKETIEQYKNGEISYEDVQSTIESFDKKQEGAVNIIANAATGLTTAGIAVATGGIGALAVGAAIGGATKAGLKTLDRATNNIEGDALDAKQIAKDGLTGAIDGAISTVTAGMIKAPVAGQTVSQAVKTGIIQGAKAGALSGAITGAGDYTAEAIFEEDVDFTIEGLMGSTAQNAVAGGVMGGIMGGITSGFAQNKLNNQTQTNQNIQADTKPLETDDTEIPTQKPESQGETAEIPASSKETQPAEIKETATDNTTRQPEASSITAKTKHAESVEASRKYYDTHKQEIDSMWLNDDVTFKDLWINSEGKIVSRYKDSYKTFTINDIISEYNEEIGILSHATSAKNAAVIQSNGFDPGYSKTCAGLADGVYFMQGENVDFWGNSESIVNATLDGKICSADLSILESISGKLNVDYDMVLADTDVFSQMNGQLPKVFLQRLISDRNYSGIISPRLASNEIAVLDASKIRICE